MINYWNIVDEKIIELHIYMLPREVWITKQRLAYNETIQEAISLGFIRVDGNLLMSDLRVEIKKQCVNEDVPPEYVFLRSVGRALTRVKPHQEFELKARYFLPPIVRFVLWLLLKKLEKSTIFSFNSIVYFLESWTRSLSSRIW